MPELIRDVLYARMRMENRDGDGVMVFTSHAWSRLFETRGPHVRELILEFLSILRSGERDISTDGEFLGAPPSYTLIRDPVLRLCHRIMAHSIAGRSQALKKDLLGKRVMKEELLKRIWWHQEVVMRMRIYLRLCHHHLGLRVAFGRFRDAFSVETYIVDLFIRAPPDPYSAATQFRGVTDWYQDPRTYIYSLVVALVDLEDSTVTYTEVSYEFEEPSDIGSLGVMVYEYDRLPMHLPSPNYVPGPEHPTSLDYMPGPEHPPLLDSISNPVYPKFTPPKDDVLPAEEQPLPATDPEEDPADYPTDIYDEEEEESSRDDGDDEEEEDPALADSISPPLVHHTTSRISILAQAHVPFLFRAKVKRLLALPTLPPSPLTSYSSSLPHIPSPPLPASPTHPLGYRAAMIRLTAESPSTFHLLPQPIVLSHTRFEVYDCSSAPTARPTRGFRANYGFVGTPDVEIRCDPDREIGYGITDVWEDPYEIVEEIPATNVVELSQRMIDFVTTIRQDTDEICERLDDAQDDRLLMSGQLNSLCRDRRSHARTAKLMKSEARASCEAWAQSMDASDTARSETQMAALQSQQRPVKDLAHPYVPKEADSYDSVTGVRRQAPLAHECTYPDFIKCKPLYFKGTERVIELTRWFERMETMFRISNCIVENQIKYSTYTLLGSDLMWWNSRVKTVGHDVDYAMTWTNLKKKMIDKYCLRGEIKKSEVEMWNLNVKGTDVNNNQGNPAGNGNAPAKVYTVGYTGTNPDSNVVTGTFLLNNRYAIILFDIGTDRSFMSTAFSSQIDITPTTLDHYYDVELADGRIVELNTII
nr:reverse transcriptase domain-containing protein [Tanacetum cinerariifolium]